MVRHHGLMSRFVFGNLSGRRKRDTENRSLAAFLSSGPSFRVPDESGARLQGTGQTLREEERKMDHTIVHFEIPADNPERATKFYRDLFG